MFRGADWNRNEDKIKEETYTGIRPLHTMIVVSIKWEMGETMEVEGEISLITVLGGMINLMHDKRR